MPIEGTAVGGLDGSTISVLRLAIDSCLLYMHMLPAVVVFVDDNVDERLMKGHSIREHFQGPYMMMMMIILMMLVMMKKAHNSESNH